MELVVKHFSELSPNELLEIYKLRVAVFVVEQKCPYQEVDDADRVAYHLWLKDEEGIEAYARVLPQGTTFEEASLGRVIAVKRRCGLAVKLWKRRSMLPEHILMRIRSPSKRRFMRVRCMKSMASGRFPRNF